jgi:hypothetical protein
MVTLLNEALVCGAERPTPEMFAVGMCRTPIRRGDELQIAKAVKLPVAPNNSAFAISRIKFLM